MKPAYYLKAVLKHVVSRDFTLKNSVHGTSSVSYQEQTILYGIVSYLIIPCPFTSLLKRKLQYVGHKWVIHVGHIRIALWVSGSGGSTGVANI